MLNAFEIILQFSFGNMFCIISQFCLTIILQAKWRSWHSRRSTRSDWSGRSSETKLSTNRMHSKEDSKDNWADWRLHELHELASLNFELHFIWSTSSLHFAHCKQGSEQAWWTVILNYKFTRARGVIHLLLHVMPIGSKLFILVSKNAKFISKSFASFGRNVLSFDV